MVLALTILSLGCILAYTLAVCLKFKGIPNSISASFYSLEHKYWFRFTMWVAPMLLLPAILEVSKQNTEFLAFLAIVGMIIVGCFPDYANDKFSKRGHESGAIMTMVFSQIWVGFNKPIFLSLWALYLLYTATSMFIAYKKMNNLEFKVDFRYLYINTNPLFWIEIFAITSTFLSLFFI